MFIDFGFCCVKSSTIENIWTYKKFLSSLRLKPYCVAIELVDGTRFYEDFYHESTRNKFYLDMVKKVLEIQK